MSEELVRQFDQALRRIARALDVQEACGGVDTDDNGGHTAEVIEKRALDLIAAATQARQFIKQYHWRFCPPGDKWPEGSWNFQAAKEAFFVLDAVLGKKK